MGSLSYLMPTGALQSGASVASAARPGRAARRLPNSKLLPRLAGGKCHWCWYRPVGGGLTAEASRWPAARARARAALISGAHCGVALLSSHGSCGQI